jgi:hypothetical protein
LGWENGGGMDGEKKLGNTKKSWKRQNNHDIEKIT